MHSHLWPCDPPSSLSSAPYLEVEIGPKTLHQCPSASYLQLPTFIKTSALISSQVIQAWQIGHQMPPLFEAGTPFMLPLRANGKVERCCIVGRSPLGLIRQAFTTCQIVFNDLIIARTLRIVHPQKITILSFTQPHVIPNRYAIAFSMKHKCRHFWKMLCNIWHRTIVYSDHIIKL